ncbi:branched-chain amino acid ABC transporter permease [candidate division KSB3 bacterium]|uniref:Branched-chain amino acid ABC transporter permease n=1 Tax=candidate division KSB3 bacterium TaxID=2044937 RepID=A0A9D5Q751_9BACT|nr:branched-chain amino acid ABC transporter permease [candidate division KSB3 bacterium]MBD3326490.1 branched-chain amino acid ABC transporter permease [candidate division KSB3 bacterium]
MSRHGGFRVDSNLVLQQLLNGISLGGVYALEAVGFGLIFNILKFSNFSHGGVVAICAYVGYFITQHLIHNFVLSLLATAIIGGLVGILIEKLVFRPVRLKGAPVTLLIVNSITVAMLVQQFFAVTLGADYYPYPELFEETAIHFGDLTVSKTYLLMLAISGVVLLVLSYIIQKTKVGIAIRAISSDIRTPSLMGVNVDHIISIAFFLAGILGGITGYLLGMTYTVDPFIGSMILKGIIAAIIGGMGSLAGGAIAGILLGAVESLLIAEIGASLTPIAVYSSIIILLLIRPEGIAGKRYVVKA